MTHRIALLSAAALLTLAPAYAEESAGPQEVETVTVETVTVDGLTAENQQFSYAVGQGIGRSLAPFADEVDPAAVLRGLVDSLEGKEPALTQEQMEAAQRAAVARAQARMQAEQEAAKAKNQAAADAFLAENAKKDGVKTTKSGLQYQVLAEGEGEHPKASDRVKVHYRGQLLDGTEFDSSYSRNAPTFFAVGQVIPGWVEGLQLMKPGAKYRFWIPPQLAYGERGAGDKIGPNEALVFDVELLAINPKAEDGKDAE